MKLLSAAFIALLVSCVYAQESVAYKVLDVTDAETLIIQSERGAKATTRIAGIDAPETDQPFNKEATDRLVGLIKGKDVRVQLIRFEGTSRMVSKILLDGNDVGLTLIQTGFAWHRNEKGELSPADAEKYAIAQGEAKAKRIGLWAMNAIEPKEWRRTSAATPTGTKKPKEIFIGIV